MTILKAVLRRVIAVKPREHGKTSPGLHILVACLPKSGSTYLAKLLREITGFQAASLVQFYGHNEHDIYEYRLRQVTEVDTVTQQHVKGTDNNIRLIKKYDVRPVILTRDIYDVLLSLYDHIERRSPKGPAGYVHQDYFSMAYDEKLEFLIRIFLPWHFNFLISWYEGSKDLRAFWTSYEKLFANPAQEITEILGFCGLSYHFSHIESCIAAMETKDTRLNVGISGRGEELADYHREAIAQLANCWKVDSTILETIGIDL